ARSPGMTNEHVDRLYEEARRSGAIGGKLVGAGGGGFLLVYTRRPEDTRRAMAAAQAPELAFDFEFGGAHASEYA
ncbi:MAG TPA: galactokinase, partial [Patescibacteria group bacterium]|nr:galactokinase [Patescibacteria group bacterium]